MRRFFAAQVTLSEVCAPDLGPLKIDVKDLQWKDAFVTHRVNDLRGTREALMLDWGATNTRCYRARRFPDTQPCDGIAGYRSTDCERKPNFHSTRFQRERRNLFRRLLGAEEATFKIDWPDRPFRGAIFACGKIGAS